MNHTLKPMIADGKLNGNLREILAVGLAMLFMAFFIRHHLS